MNSNSLGPASAATLRPVDAGNLFVYPIQSSERLETHSYLKFEFRRWKSSDFRNLADLAVKGAFLEIISGVRDQSPIGTLPMDPRLQAKIVGVGLEEWTALCSRTLGPLYGWEVCVTDRGETRLYHPVVMETVEEAISSRGRNADKQDADRERKRLIALPDQMSRAGAHKMMCEDRALVVRFDAFLTQHFDGRQRRPSLIREALEAFEAARGG